MSLERIRGQDEAVAIIRSGIEQQKVAHAYLFLGPKGVGKTRTAIEFSKLLNCQEAGAGGCDQCPSCLKTEALTHPDLFLISRGTKTSSISIERIRDLQQRLSLKPFQARYKVIIIVDAEDMTEQASNCLLKILEEPTPDTVFIITASNQIAIAQTVISRCQIVRFRPLSRDLVNEILREEFSVEEGQARFLSAVSGGDIGKALFLNERDTLSWKNNIIDAFIVEKTPLTQDKIQMLGDNKQTRLEAMDCLLGFYRDILVYKFTQEAQLTINIDRIDEISRIADDMDRVRIESYIIDILNAKRMLQANVNMKLAIGDLQEKLTA